MRIISGEFKGREINFLKNSNTRPLKDAVKENIFNILKHSNKIKIKIENSNILDLYSGIGSFGIECISRGAGKVTFVEKEENAVKLLKENLLNLSIISKSKIFDSEINEILTKLESHGTELNNYSHDYQRLILLNKHIEELFKKKRKEISSMNELKQDDTKKIK